MGFGISPLWKYVSSRIEQAIDGVKIYLTGNLELYKPDPQIILTDSGNDESGGVRRSDTDNLLEMWNRTLSQGQPDYGITFNGSDEYGQVADNVNHDPGLDHFSFATWIKTIAATAQYGIFTKSLIGGYNNSWMLKNVSSTIAFYVLYGGVLKGVWDAWTNINDGNWHLAAGTIDRNGYQRLYVDAIEVGTPIDVSAYSAVDVNCVLKTTLGSYHTIGNYFPGTLFQPAIWKGRVLTPGEISDMWNGGAGLYLDPANTFPSSGVLIGTNLVSLYENVTGTGTTYADKVSAINLELVNTDDTNWSAGPFNVPGAMHENTGITIEDGIATGEHAIVKAGYDNCRWVANGKTHEWWIDGVLAFTLRADKVLHAETVDYETLVADDDDMPNKKYMDDADALLLPLAGGTLSGDVDFDADSKGVILTDRTTTTQYRLYVDGGALLIEAV